MPRNTLPKELNTQQLEKLEDFLLNRIELDDESQLVDLLEQYILNKGGLALSDRFRLKNLVNQLPKDEFKKIDEILGKESSFFEKRPVYANKYPILPIKVSAIEKDKGASTNLKRSSHSEIKSSELKNDPPANTTHPGLFSYMLDAAGSVISSASQVPGKIVSATTQAIAYPFIGKK